VEDLIRGIVVVGQRRLHRGGGGAFGTEEAFVELMNKRVSSSGSNIATSATHTASRTQSQDDRAICSGSPSIYREYPDYYHYFSEREFVFNNIKQAEPQSADLQEHRRRSAGRPDISAS
jgi:D-alanyl-D-alanine carboxypeptidase (penicillin-binding protein 5/6)